jgi:cytidylate kinase
MMTVLAIDGPGGAGKSTVSRLLAHRLGLEHLDTGAMYRALTWALLQAGLDPTDQAGAAELAARIDIEVEDTPQGQLVTVGGADVSSQIRSPTVTGAVSVVSAHPPVRQELVRRQRQWVQRRNGGVVEGRDIGTVVFPEARLKVYLTASPEERARRRAVEASGGRSVVKVAEDLSRRDRMDSTRRVSPLTVAPDAVVIDTTDMALEAVVEDLMSRL